VFLACRRYTRWIITIVYVFIVVLGFVNVSISAVLSLRRQIATVTVDASRSGCRRRTGGRDEIARTTVPRPARPGLAWPVWAGLGWWWRLYSGVNWSYQHATSKRRVADVAASRDTRRSTRRRLVASPSSTLFMCCTRSCIHPLTTTGHWTGQQPTSAAARDWSVVSFQRNATQRNALVYFLTQATHRPKRKYI